MIISMKFDRATPHKFRWDFRPSGESTVFSLYIPQWRVPDPCPERILVTLDEQVESIPSERLTQEVAARDSSSRNCAITVLIERKEVHINSVQYEPQGLKTEWEIGEPYIPHSLLPTPIPGRLRLSVDWKNEQ